MLNSRYSRLERWYMRKRIVGIVAVCMLLMMGCTQEAVKVIPQEEEQQCYYSMEECALPDYEKLLTVPQGCQIYSPSIGFAGECAYRQTIIAAQDYVSEPEVYWQTWKKDMGDWENANMLEHSFVQDGAGYTLSGSFYGNSQGKLYAQAFLTEVQESEVQKLEEGGKYIASFDEARLEEVIGPLSEEFLTEWDAKGYDTDSLFRDKEGNFYKCTKWSDEITCYDSALNKQGTFQVLKYAYGILQGEDAVYWYGCDMSNRPVVGNLTEEKIVLEDVEGIATDYVAEISEEGVLFLADTQNVWRVEAGTIQKVFPFAKNGYLLSEIYHMEMSEQGEMLFWVKMDGVLTQLRMREIDKPQKKQEVTIAFAMQHNALNRSIARFNRQNSEYYVSVLLPKEGESEEDFRDRVQMELSAGKGPDILGHDIVSYFSGYDRVSHLESYVENGYIECVDELFEEDAMYLKAALDTCRIDGELYGVPYDCVFEMAIYDKSVVGERTSWTITELMEAVQASDAEILDEGYKGLAIVREYALDDNTNATYIDWEKGESHLDEQSFLELLEFAKEYADLSNAEQKAYAVTDFSPMFELRELKRLFAQFENDAVILGYPREEGYGIYVDARQLFLSANAGCEEGAKAFLRFLISEEEQIKYATYDSSQQMRDEGLSVLYGHTNQFPIFLKAFDALVELELRKDRDNLIYTDSGVKQVNDMYTEDMIEQFYFMIEHAEPDIPKAAAITDILGEELAPYFSGDITAKEAAEKLHNRVQLYLDENA